MQSPPDQCSAGRQKQIVPPLEDAPRQRDNFRILQRFSSADRHHRRVALFHRRQTLFNGERRTLYRRSVATGFAAIRTATSERLQREEQWKLAFTPHFFRCKVFCRVENQPEGVPHWWIRRRAVRAPYKGRYAAENHPD